MTGGAKGRMLVIRLHALGDVLVTLPYLNDVKRRHPELELDLLTREEYAAIPRALDLFARVHGVRGARGFKRSCLGTAALVPGLWRRRYDAVIDLQANEIARATARILGTPVAGSFDRFAPRPAGEKTREALEEAGLGPVALDTRLVLTSPARAVEPDGAIRTVVLNPAGAFPSRHWPLESYVRFARAYRERAKGPVRFETLGLDALKPRTDPLRDALGDALHDRVGRTSLLEAFSIVRRAELVLSEDSGLMHMAWVSGVPTLALFGSSRGDWSRPLGPHTICLDSADLDCGYCMEPTCRHGDNRCLTRHDPVRVAELALDLVRARAKAGAGKALPA